MKINKNKNVCIVCQSDKLTDVIKIEDIPIHCNLLFDSREKAVNIARGDINLVFCENCGHFFNTSFDPSAMKYAESYENSLHFSPHFRHYAEELAQGLIEGYDLYGKTIVDIGCGRGDFLKLICRMGSNKGYGFDKSYVAELNDNEDVKNVQFIQDFYGERYANLKTDFVLCRHVLEHIENPGRFLQGIRKTVGQAPVFFEVPNVHYTVANLGIWDLIYEHVSYFSSASLVRLFQKSGFEILDIRETYDGQFLTVEALTAPAGPNELKTNGKEFVPLARKFAEAYRGKVRCMIEQVNHIFDKNGKVVVWGAGSKGVTMLNILGMMKQIEYIVDVNPRKEGHYVAGTGQRIVPPLFLEEYKPEAVVVMNRVYASEIHDMLNEMSISCDFLFA
jgi:SAM-dependent methyltransferase